MRKAMVVCLLVAVGAVVALSSRDAFDHRRSARKAADSEAQGRRAEDFVRALRERTRKPPRFVTAQTRPTFPGTVADPASPELLYWLEQRDPVWAPQMESALANSYLRAEVFDRLGLWRMRVTEVSCRQTTCRLSYEYPSELRRVVAATGLAASSPMVLVEEELGWAAPRGGGFQLTPFKRDGEDHEHVSMVLGFDESSWEPSAYTEWVQSQTLATRDFYRNARAARQAAADRQRAEQGNAAEPADAG